MKYQPVIGLEIHVELKTASKIIDDSMPRKNFWPYKDGLVHV